MTRYLGLCLAALHLTTAVAWAQGHPRDAIDLSKAVVYNSPADVASWPITTAITQLHMRPRGVSPEGVSLVFSAQQTWPDYWPPGWSGPLQYTVWAVVKINGTWYTSGFIQMWRGRASTGAPILTDFAINWAYDSRWGPMNHYQPKAGEQMGFFVTAGNARGVYSVTSVRERSNVVLVSLPSNDYGDFTFQAGGRTLSDFDGDGKADIVVFRPSNGLWIGLSSTNNYSYATYQMLPWGQNGDIPVPGDYDGDGKADVAFYRPSDGTWYIKWSNTNFQTSSAFWWGSSTDIPVPGDYDGDGKTELAVFNKATGIWYMRFSRTWYTTWAGYQFGTATDVPVPADYDGDGRTDPAFYRNGSWNILNSSTNYFTTSTFNWGTGIDIPVPGDYDGDGKAEIAVFNRATAIWYMLMSRSGYAWVGYHWGVSTDIPVPADFDGDGRIDPAFYRPSTGEWQFLKSTTNYFTSESHIWGQAGDMPIAEKP